MIIEWPTIIEAGIPLLGGLFATAIGFGLIKRNDKGSGWGRKLIPHLRWMGPIIVVNGLFVGWQTHERFNHPSADQLAQILSSKVSLPQRVDNVTTLVSIIGLGNTLFYKYDVSTALPEESAQNSIEDKLKGKLKTAACDDPQAKVILDRGYEIELQYSFAGYPPRQIDVKLSSDACET